MVTVADLRMDLRDRTVQRGSQRLPVKGRSFQLLQVLIERYPETAGHRELLQRVWTGRVVTADALSQRVRMLRKALGDDRGDDGYIASVHGQGYRLAHAPTRAPDSADAERTRLALPPRAAWVVLAVAIPLLLALLGFSQSHAIKHFIRHLS